MIREKNEGRIFVLLCHPLDLTSQTFILNIYNEFHVRKFTIRTRIRGPKFEEMNC